MKTAIGLFGIYSDIYQKNKYVGDIFTYTYTLLMGINDPNIIRSDIISTDKVNFNNVREIEKRALIKRDLITYCEEMMNKQEIERGFPYNIKIFAYFNEIILEFPKTPGKFYSTTYGGFSLPTNMLPSIEIVSDMYVRCGQTLESIYDIGNDMRQILFEKLFGDRIIVPNSGPLPPSTIVFCIPSVIRTSSNSLMNTSIRSVFTSEERFQQTLEQLISLTTLVGNVYLMEGSRLNISELTKLSQYARIILTTLDTKANYLANVHPNKSAYEVWCIRYMLENLESDWLFKFGGRYSIQPSFDISTFLKPKPVFKIIKGENTYTGNPIVITVLYSIPKSFREEYKKIYDNMLDQLCSSNNIAIEDLLCLNSSGEREEVEYLHVLGRDAMYGFTNYL